MTEDQQATPNTLSFVKHEKVHLRSHPLLNEAWVQDQIAADPTILGLGDLVMLDRERRQERAGRLDLLLGDGDQNTRYEVELMLGATDASHIVRCIEYWDIERRRYPGYDHYAVIVAEDITSRFINVLSLFAGSIPLIAIQMSAIQIGEQIALHFVKILDQRQLRVDDVESSPSQVTDRAYWEGRANLETLPLADELLQLINANASSLYQLNYNKQYIGLTDGLRTNNFVIMRPRKRHMRCNFYLRDGEIYRERLEEAGLSVDTGRKGQLIVNLSKQDLRQHKELLREFVGVLVDEQES